MRSLVLVFALASYFVLVGALWVTGGATPTVVVVGVADAVVPAFGPVELHARFTDLATGAPVASLDARVRARGASSRTRIRATALDAPSGSDPAVVHAGTTAADGTVTFSFPAGPPGTERYFVSVAPIERFVLATPWRDEASESVAVVDVITLSTDRDELRANPFDALVVDLDAKIHATSAGEAARAPTGTPFWDHPLPPELLVAVHRQRATRDRILYRATFRPRDAQIVKHWLENQSGLPPGLLLRERAGSSSPVRSLEELGIRVTEWP